MDTSEAVVFEIGNQPTCGNCGSALEFSIEDIVETLYRTITCHYCYASLAWILRLRVDPYPFGEGECPSCKMSFAKNRNAQTFCSRACANRSR